MRERVASFSFGCTCVREMREEEEERRELFFLFIKWISLCN